MNPKFQNKFRIESARLQGYDYRNEGAYFITICTKNRDHYFGECTGGKMQLNAIGSIANHFWDQIPDHFANISLGEFVVMPNHIHGIIIINEKIEMERSVSSLLLYQATSSESPVSRVETHNYASLPPTTTLPTTIPQLIVPLSSQSKHGPIGPPAKSISTMIRAYKSAVTQQAKIINNDYGWQARFHDHIVRSQPELDRIANYIMNNPSNWKEDRFFEKRK